MSNAGNDPFGKKMLIEDRTETMKQIALDFLLQIKHILYVWFFLVFVKDVDFSALATAKCNVFCMCNK